MDILDWPLLEQLDCIWIEDEDPAKTANSPSFSSAYSKRHYGGGGIVPTFVPYNRGTGEGSSPLMHYQGVDIRDTLEGLKEEEVIVLPTSSVAHSALANVARVGAFDLRPFGDEGRGVSVESIWRFKGLDRPAVVIVGISDETDDALKYVAMTRARRVLVLIGEKSALETP